MTTEAGANASRAVQSLLEEVDGEVEALATEGGITADTRGNLSVEMLLRIARWRSVQSVVVYNGWAEVAEVPDPDVEATMAAAWKAGQSVDQYEAATERLREIGVTPEPVEFEIHGDTLALMADLADPIARLTVGFVVAPKLRVVKDKQATLVATGSADPQTASLFREEIVPPEEAAIDRGKALLDRALDTNPAAVDTIETTAQDFLAVAWESQKRAMDETGEIDPKTVC